MLIGVLLFLFFCFFFNWDLELMSLTVTKRCHPDFNKARNSPWLLILNGQTMQEQPRI